MRKKINIRVLNNIMRIEKIHEKRIFYAVPGKWPRIEAGWQKKDAEHGNKRN